MTLLLNHLKEISNQLNPNKIPVNSNNEFITESQITIDYILNKTILYGTEKDVNIPYKLSKIVDELPKLTN